MQPQPGTRQQRHDTVHRLMGLLSTHSTRREMCWDYAGCNHGVTNQKTKTAGGQARK
jgi:hypothetical protein